MNNILEFPERKYSVAFCMPSNTNVINVRKKSTDKIQLEFSASGGVAHVHAYNIRQAQNYVKRVLPDSVIIDDTVHDS